MSSPTFADIDARTRAQLETDHLEAAARGITGDAFAIADSFEATLTEYLAMDPDLKRDFPRGETARLYGTALGDALVSEHGFTWKVLSDDYGTDLVVMQTPQHFTAPMVVVDARFEDEESGRLSAFLTQFLA